MSINQVTALLCCFFYTGLQAQNNTIRDVLASVLENNRELEALSIRTDSRKLELKSKNGLPQPQFAVYYLPFGVHSTTDYSEFEFSQRMEFPTVYSNRAKVIDRQSELLKATYNKLRQEILLEAKSICIELIYLNKQIETKESRLEQISRIVEELKKDSTNQLEYNKANLLLIQHRLEIQNTKQQKRAVKEKLVQLNGGKSVNGDLSSYSTELTIPSFDDLWSERNQKDPELRKLSVERDLAEQSLKLQKHQNLPDIIAGYNSQGFAGERYSGVYAGLSIPLWNNRNKVRAAKNNLDYRHAITGAQSSNLKREYKTQHYSYLSNLEQYNDYSSSLRAIQSTQILLKAYQSGKIAFSEFYGEYEFYNDAIDAQLEMEYNLFHSKAKLLEHRL